MKKATALIIDDEPDICELLEITLARMDIETTKAENLQRALSIIDQKHFDLCLTDMCLPDGNGIDFVKEMQVLKPELPIAVITAHGSIETAIQALKAGAFDFVPKPVDLQKLRNMVSTAMKLKNKNSLGAEHDTLKELLGDSEQIFALKKTIKKISSSQAPVAIYGDSGTGKELVARLIHEQGPRADAPFVPVNCGAIPSELIESEFFGHKKGSFTGAHSDKAGLFISAEGGTLFLDEIGELPMSLQVKLLRVIQEKAIRPVGATREIPTNVRLISATHKNLHQMVQAHLFRQDLYYRINVIEIKVPSLIERKEDIPLLVQHILKKITGKETDTLQLDPLAMESLMQYSFPGNIRELENILERSITLCDSTILRKEDLQLPEENTLGVSEKNNNTSEKALEPYLIDIEKKAIMEALEKTKWHKTKAAKLLGISFRALRYRLKKLGIDEDN